MKYAATLEHNTIRRLSRKRSAPPPTYRRTITPTVSPPPLPIRILLTGTVLAVIAASWYAARHSVWRC